MAAEVNIEDEFRKIRNRLRRYSAASIAEQALLVLHRPSQDPVEKLSERPWHTLLLVKWALIDRVVHLFVGPTIPASAFDQLRQDLWDLQNRASTSAELWPMLRTLIHPQVQFQLKESWGFLRWPALISRLAENHTTRIQFQTTLGMSPNDFMDLCFATYGSVLTGSKAIDLLTFEPLKIGYGVSVDAFLGLFVRDIRGLREELQGPSARRIRGKGELFEFPYLQRFPFLQVERTLHCWHPIVFARGMEDAVHLRLSELGQAYSDSFSKVFEEYVFELLDDTRIGYFSEDEIWKQAGVKTSVVEAVIDCTDCNVFVESKMSLFWDSVLVGDDPEGIFDKSNHVRKAIKQGWQVSDLVRSGRVVFGSCANKDQDYLLIVTSRQLNIGGGLALQRLYPEGAFEEVLPIERRQHLPPQNIFVLSIEDFERLTGCLRSGEVELGPLLKNAALANSEPKSSRMYFSDFLNEHVKGRWTNSRLIDESRDASERRLSKSLHAVEMSDRPTQNAPVL